MSRSKYSPTTFQHPTKEVPREFLGHTPTRRVARATARKLEYRRLGVGLHIRPVFDLPRRTLRAIARAIVQRQWQERANVRPRPR